MHARARHTIEVLTLVGVLRSSTRSIGSFPKIVASIDRCDVASQHGLPKPTFETPDGEPIFPEDEDDAWWLTDVSKRVASEDKIKSDEDGPAADDEGVDEGEQKGDVSDDDPLTDAEEVTASSSNQHVPVAAWSTDSWKKLSCVFIVPAHAARHRSNFNSS